MITVETAATSISKESDWTSDLLNKGCNAGKRLKNKNASHDENKMNSVNKKEKHWAGI